MAIRGRVMSIYIMVMVGGQAIGGVVMGWIAEHLGTTIAFAVAGLVPALAGITVAIILAHRHQLRIRFGLRTRAGCCGSCRACRASGRARSAPAGARPRPRRAPASSAVRSGS